MLETYVFYTLLMSFMMALSYQMKPDNRQSFDVGSLGMNIYVIICIYTFFIGFRYLVGVDYATYLGWYKELLATGRFPPDEKKEFGYVFLNEVLYYLDAHYSILFLIISFLQIFFLYKAIDRFQFLRHWYIFFFFTSLLMFSSMNIMRQTLAYFAFFYALNLAESKKYYKSVIIAILGYSFHKSILFGIVLYPFIKLDWFKRRDIQLVLLAIVILFSSQVLSYFLLIISPITKVLGYDYYIENLDSMYELTKENAVGAGFGKYLFIALDLTIIYYSTKLKSYFEQYGFQKFYNLYFLGALLDRLVYDNFILSRTNDYLLNFRVLILSFLAQYLLSHKSKYSANKLLLFLIVCVMLAYFYRGINNSAAKSSPFEMIFNN